MKFPKYSGIKNQKNLDTDIVDLQNVEKANRTKLDMKDDKKVDRFIRKCKYMIRSSHHYKDLIKFLKEERDMKRSRTMMKMDKEEMPNLKIEVHHSPFTITDIIETVLKKQVSSGEYYSLFSVAHEVMLLHYKKHVGLIPLDSTSHNLIHNDKIQIPISMVFGNVDKFISNYESFMSYNMKQKYELANKYDVDILKPKFIYVNGDEEELLTIEELEEIIDVKRNIDNSNNKSRKVLENELNNL